MSARQTGALPEMLMKIADQCDEDVDNAASAMTSLLEPILIVFLAVVVGSIVIAMFLPLVRIMEVGFGPAQRREGLRQQKIADRRPGPKERLQPFQFRAVIHHRTQLARGFADFAHQLRPPVELHSGPGCITVTVIDDQHRPPTISMAEGAHDELAGRIVCRPVQAGARGCRPRPLCWSPCPPGARPCC